MPRRMGARYERQPSRLEMKKPLLVGVTALFLVAGTAHATEYQGNLPKPVQKLPAYPPVACVAPDWSVKSCGDRQTPLPHPNPLRAFDPRPPLDMGGFAQYPIINKSNGPLQFPNAEKVEEKVPGIPYPPIRGLFRIRPEAPSSLNSNDEHRRCVGGRKQQREHKDRKSVV